MSDLIRRKLLLESAKEIQKQRNGCEPQSGSIINLIKNAPAVSGVPIGYIETAQMQSVLAGDTGLWFKDKDGQYNLAIYTTPQQPQEQDELVRKAVADALEEAANLVFEIMYMNGLGGTRLQDKLVEEIRALIKRNAEGVE